MPYIKPERRLALVVDQPQQAGELNYRITNIINAYRKHNGDNYQIYNDIIGALESAKMEFYRRIIIPYENMKLKDNGDVY